MTTEPRFALYIRPALRLVFCRRTAGQVRAYGHANHASRRWHDDRRSSAEDHPGVEAYIGPNDRQITQVTGQTFGEAYLSGLLSDHSAWLDSEPPTAAVLAAEPVNAAGLDMLARLYEAHYLEGRRIADKAILIDLAQEVGLVRGAFAEALGPVARSSSAQPFRGEP